MSSASFISTTIPYVNARPHIGHALEYVQSDAYARHLATRGKDVFFLSGSDENSLKNVLAAERLGISTAELVQSNVVAFEQLMKDLDIKVNRFIRTSVDPDHIKGAIGIWRRMEQSGDIYTKEYEGLYCVGCEQFYSEAELDGGLCPEHQTAPETVRERNYFFRLSRYQEKILELLEKGHMRVTPTSRLNEVIGFVRGGLEDISISRTSDRARGWGIPVPDDPGQVMYVWIDALTNYTNALGWADGAEAYSRYWENATDRIHVVGKGVIRFHAVYWPAMLLSAGLPLPTEIVVHGYITLAGRKQSKSLGNVVDPIDLVARYGTSAVRYFLLADISPFADSDFQEERIAERYTVDLANGLGNLVSRVTSMVGRYRDGVVPQAGKPEEPELGLARQVAESASSAIKAMDRYDHREALARIWDLVRRSNAYVDERAPWHLAKTAAEDSEAAAALDLTLLHAAGAVRQLGALLVAFLPEPASQILDALGDSPATVPGADRWLEGLPGRAVTKPAPLFPRLDSQ